MSAHARAAALGLCLLNGCAADVVSVGAWVEKSKPDDPGPIRDASPPDPRSDGSVTPPTKPPGIYFEAELAELSGPFAISMDAEASGGEFLTSLELAQNKDMPGDARARYVLDIPKDGEYTFWGRIHAQDERHNRFWFQVDGGTWYLWRLSTGDVWYWDDLHHETSYLKPTTFILSRGVHELTLANATAGVDLDRLYFTSEGDTPPGNTTLCSPPDSVEIGGQCLPSCGSLMGTACGPTRCGAGTTLLSAYDCDVCCRL